MISTKTATGLTEQVIATLRAHQAELRRAGIRYLSLSGYVGRSEADADGDVDLVAEPDADLRFDPCLPACVRRFAAGHCDSPKAHRTRLSRSSCNPSCVYKFCTRASGP